MADSSTDSKRIPYQPLHPSVRSELDPDYVKYHDEHFQFLEPLKPDTEWNSDLRTAPSRFALTSSRPVKVGSVRDVDLGNFHVLVYTPEGVPPTAGWPVLLGIHGGGGVQGGPSSDGHIWTRICYYTSCVVVSVGYRLAPENPYPTAHEDCFDALKWVIEEGPTEININQSCVLIAGMSSGGNLAAVTTMKVAEADLPVNLILQILMVPVCDNTATPESGTWQQRPNAPLLTMKRMALFQKWYLGCRNSPHWAGDHWTASPVRAPLYLLRKCPKTVIIIAGQDLLRGESLEFAQILRKAEVDVDIKEYDGAPHMFMAMDMVLESGKRAVDQVVELVKKALVEYSEHSIKIKPSDVNKVLDRQNLLEQAKTYEH